MVADGFSRAMPLVRWKSFYRTERFDGYDNDSLVVVAGKYGEDSERHFEIAFFRSIDLTTQLEVSLSYPANLRCLFLRTFSDCCDSLDDANRLFHAVRVSRWFRRYASIPATSCDIRWRGEEEMADMMGEIIPKLMEAHGPDL